MDIFRRHKPIRNKINKFTPISIIETGINILHSKIDTSPNAIDWLRREGTYFPWIILILIRWVYQYSTPKVEQRAITLPEFNDLHNAINDLNSSVFLEGQPTERLLQTYTRRTLFYQLPFQIKKYEVMSSFGRQLIMFQDMGNEYCLDQIFKGITGITLKDYYDLYIYCWIECDNGKRKRFSTSFFDNQFPVHVVQGFFEHLSLDLNGAKQYIKKYTDPRAAIDFQLNEHTPLEKYPFFKFETEYIPYTSRLLDNSIMYNTYDTFKTHNPHFSRDGFGKIFEDYVGKGVEYITSDFMREAEIKKLLPRDSKVADFLINEQNATILIDAKSTEFHSIARVLQTKESTIKNIRDTIISGVIQIITTAHHLKNCGRINNDNKIFGIVVTYKEYLIGDGNTFWNDIISDQVHLKLDQNKITNVIQPENLFYISIEDYDYLMAGIKKRGTSLSSVLKIIALRNRSPDTSGLIVKQHLDAIWGEYYRPQYIAQRCEEFFDTLRQRFLLEDS